MSYLELMVNLRLLILIYRLTKSAPSKSKLMKKTFRDISNFQESAKVLYQEVDVCLFFVSCMPNDPHIMLFLEHHQGDGSQQWRVSRP